MQPTSMTASMYAIILANMDFFRPWYPRAYWPLFSFAFSLRFDSDENEFLRAKPLVANPQSKQYL